MENNAEKNAVLFVDDEQVVLNVGALMLRKLGYEVFQAKSGVEAIQTFKANKDGFCLVLLDINMPGENGSETCIRLKRINPKVRVVHTSGMGICQADQTMQCGCKGFMSKPFGLEELSKKLQETLEVQSE